MSIQLRATVQAIPLALSLSTAPTMPEPAQPSEPTRVTAAEFELWACEYGHGCEGVSDLNVRAEARGGAI